MITFYRDGRQKFFLLRRQLRSLLSRDLSPLVPQLEEEETKESKKRANLGKVVPNLTPPQLNWLGRRNVAITNQDQHFYRSPADVLERLLDDIEVHCIGPPPHIPSILIVGNLILYTFPLEPSLSLEHYCKCLLNLPGRIVTMF